LQTSNVALHNFPAMNKLVDVTKLQILHNPTMEAIRTAFQIKDGRLVLQPFDVKLGPLTMNVAGSNGIDQSLDYRLGLKVPKSLLGGDANQAIASLVSKAGQAGVNLSAAPVIPLAIGLGGTVTNPVIKADVGSLTSSVTQGAKQAVTQAVTQKVDSVGMRLVAEAESQAAAIRQQAESLAAGIKRVGYQQADSLTAKAGDNPLAAAGAKVAADQLRQQTDQKAKGIVDEASRRADSLIATAKRQAGLK
jgi:AsmA-like C-terminal region